MIGLDLRADGEQGLELARAAAARKNVVEERESRGIPWLLAEDPPRGILCVFEPALLYVELAQPSELV
jgi:hypothetical protein